VSGVVSREPAVVVDGVTKNFRLYSERNDSLKAAFLRGGRARYQEFRALDDVSVEIPSGTTFGLVGENGSGKSTLLKCIARILRPDAGTVTSRGKMAALLELGSGFHPELSGRENVYLNGSILGLSRKELARAFDEIVDFAGIEQFIDQPVKNYSSGMYVRLGFSIAINVDPDVLLVDEVLAVGDAAFQRKCMEKFAAYRAAGKTVVVVSHDTGAMRLLCDEVAWLEHGKVVKTGRPDEVVDEYVDEGHEDRQQTEDGGTRWGSGEGRIERVELLDEQGRGTSRVRTGQQMAVRLHWSAQERLVQPVFGLALETLDGYYLWAHHSRDGGAVPDAIEGEGHVDLVVDRLMLQPGTYDLSASLNAYDCQHVFDYRRRTLRFDVESGTPRESGGPIALGGRWDLPVERAAVPGPAAGSPH
jgi:ABC-type polysaccharide/polyol phosphate transport system ATPase subunit